MRRSGRRIAVIGLGYVGLPVAVAFAKKFPGTIGFDVDQTRIDALGRGVDRTNEVAADDIRNCGLRITSNAEDLRAADIFIVCVPTPVHPDRRPDLRALQSASETVGRALRKGGIVVYESTVYPGLTEEFCGPILAHESGLSQGEHFKLAYSPERINPGDKHHTFEHIVKVVSAEDDATTQLIAELYGSVVTAGICIAPNIKVAETAKILENTQRDLNVALMNELAIICDRMGIRTKDVLKAAGSKWNFLNFTPGLVGGHCVGVAPHYLAHKAQELGCHPDVILAGRRINDSMGAIVARRLVRFLALGPSPLRDARVGVLGVTFKENVSDMRNSRVPDILRELEGFGIAPLLHDPLADPAQVEHAHGVKLVAASDICDCDGIVLAVPHDEYLRDQNRLWRLLRDGGVMIDVKSVLDPQLAPPRVRYWSL